MKMPKPAAQVGPHSLEQLDSQLADRLWWGMMALVCILTPISTIRFFSTGWLPIYSVHLATFGVVMSLHLVRGRLTASVRKVVPLLYLFGSACLSLFSMGILGFGGLWLVVTSYLVGAMYGTRPGMIAIAVNLALMMIAMALFTRGDMVIPVDANAYIRSAPVWFLASTMMLVLPTVLMKTLTLHKHAVADLAYETELQRQKIEYMATHDYLTGLVLLPLAHDRLQMAIHAARRPGHKVAVLFIDLDGFKQVNDNHGHGAGDHVLRTVGQALKRAIRKGDTASRFGGDEFLVVLANLNPADSVGAIADRIMQEITRPVLFNGRELQVGASMGIAMFPDHGDDPNCLQHLADTAMYAVKRNGKNGICTAPVPEAFATHRRQRCA